MSKGDEKSVLQSDLEAEKMWDEMSDVPFDWDENNEMFLAYDWGIFSAGTPREEIWRWFDAHHSKGVAWLLYQWTREKMKEHIKKLENISKRY